MLFENTWNNILEWFSNCKERSLLVKEFNDKARISFIRGEAPTVLKASISRGASGYRHEFSAWLNTGLRIQALSGCELSKLEITGIGQIILSDQTLVRRLIILGWDTLEIHANKGRYGCRWCLTGYAHIGQMIEHK